MRLRSRTILGDHSGDPKFVSRPEQDYLPELDMGEMQVQFKVVRTEQLYDAQRHPNDHKDLICKMHQKRLLDNVLGSPNNVVLAIRIKLDEIGRVAGDTNDKVAVRIRILLSGPHGFRAYNVVLNFHAAEV